MAQQLRALAALAEYLGSIPGNTWRLRTVCKSSSRASGALLRPLWPLHTCGALTHMQAKHSYIQNKNK